MRMMVFVDTFIFALEERIARISDQTPQVGLARAKSGVEQSRSNGDRTDPNGNLQEVTDLTCSGQSSSLSRPSTPTWKLTGER